MRRHARVLALIPPRAFVGVGVAIGLLWTWENKGFGKNLITSLAALNLPFVGDFFNHPPAWAAPVAGLVFVAAVGAITFAFIRMCWNLLMQIEERLAFGRTTTFLWAPRKLWYPFMVLSWGLVAAGVPVVLMVVVAQPEPDSPLPTSSAHLSSRCWRFAVLSGGGRTYASEDESVPTWIAVHQIVTDHEWWSRGITALIAGIYVLPPLIIFFVARDAFLPVIATYTVFLTGVLAFEAGRKALGFERRFRDWNSRPKGDRPTDQFAVRRAAISRALVVP